MTLGPLNYDGQAVLAWQAVGGVITSYSIHYTKLYDMAQGRQGSASRRYCAALRTAGGLFAGVDALRATHGLRPQDPGHSTGQPCC